MKRKELRKLLIPVLAFCMAAPAPVLAAEGGAAQAGTEAGASAGGQERPIRNACLRRRRLMSRGPAMCCRRAGSMCWMKTAA
ncbi:hypothetical protein DXA96_17610 [Lachnospiraceae bacterium OF09-33XD]|nr:hypothetical protein DXA96_17610 [Lachnospiraceae bacterium OF09-33XD]